MRDNPRELLKNRMWKKHLFWIIPLSFIMGMVYGSFFVFPNQINLTMDVGENFNHFSNVFNESFDKQLILCEDEMQLYKEYLNFTLNRINDLESCNMMYTKCLKDWC